MVHSSPNPGLDPLDAASFLRLAETRLLSQPAPLSMAVTGPSDYDLNPGTNPAVLDNLRPAAVLIGIVARESLSVLLTQRTAHLPAHAGQIAFPGGKIEPEDKGPLAAALREAREEIGLDPSYVQPLGFVEPYVTGTGFIVTPVVAQVRPGFALTPDPREVDAIFEVPLAFLLDEANHRIDSREWRGEARRYYAIPHEDRYIWGVTAGIIRALTRRLFPQ